MKPLLALVLLSVALLTGCGPVAIGRILRDPYRFRDRVVSVQGTVVHSYAVPVLPGVYQVEDGTGKISVLSNGGAPPKGSRVQVDGRVVNGATVLGRPVAIALKERDRKVKY